MEATANGAASGKPGLAERGQEHFGGVVGWKHVSISHGIDLTVQTTDNPAISVVNAHHLLMSRNQALILAKYLLDVTGQTLPPPPRRGILARLFR